MTFKEFCELKLKEYPDGIWVRFVSGYHDDEHYNDEFYLDEYYLTEFPNILDKEVTKWILDECYFDELWIWIK